MLPAKRTIEEIDSFVKLWNDRIPKFRMTLDDIQKPTAMFFISAILEILDALGFDTDGVVGEFSVEECQESECSESLRELLPVLNLTEALNTLFDALSPEIPKVTPFSLLQPSSTTILGNLRFLLNYVMFVNEREMEGAEAVEQVLNEAHRLEELKDEVERLTDEMNHHMMEGADRDHRIKQLEEKIERLKIEPTELSEMIERLRSDLLVSQEQGTHLFDEQETLHKNQAELQHEINRLRSCIVTKSEQAEVLKNKECAMQKEEEASKCKQEAMNRLWDRDTAIRALTSNMTFIRDVQAELHALETLHNKIQEMEKANSGWCEGENELTEVRGSCEEMQRRIEEIRMANRSWEEDNRKAEMEVTRELESVLREDRASEFDLEKCLSETSRQKEIVNGLKMASLQYEREREHLIKMYTKDIPQSYEADIDIKVERIKKIINTTLGKKLLKE